MHRFWTSTRRPAGEARLALPAGPSHIHGSGTAVHGPSSPMWGQSSAAAYRRFMSEGNKVIIRDALPSDAEGVAHTHVASWRETYSGVLDDRFFSEEAFTRRLRFWNRYLSTEPRPGRMAVAVQGGDVVGFANAGDALGPDAEHGILPARPLHLFSIYLLAAAQGAGTGQALLDAVAGDEPAQLWVLEQNARAISFYQRNRFAFDGVQYSDPADANMVELRMVR